MQAAHHGFGVAVNPKEMVSVNGKPLQDAILKVLTDPSYKVGASEPESTRVD